MSQALTFVGESAEDIIKSGLVHTGMAVFTAKDNISIRVFRGYKGATGIKVKISREGDQDEKKTD